MNTSTSPKIYFHVGTGKTGTTYVQYRVFPKFEGIHYIQRTKYKNALTLIAKGEFDRYLVSREFDQQLKNEVEIFSASCPQAVPIIVFRRHDSYIASQYRRFVKNGFTGSFTDFFDLKNDTGYFKKQDLDYGRMIQILEDSFDYPPLVFFYEDMKKDPIAFIKSFADRISVSINPQKLNLSNKHSSYNEQQLKGIKQFGNHVNMWKRRAFKNNILNFFWKLYLGAIRYSVLYISKFLPASWFASAPLVPKAELEKVRDHYSQDWVKCREYSVKK